MLVGVSPVRMRGLVEGGGMWGEFTRTWGGRLPRVSLTLATDYSELRGIFAFIPGTLMYLVAVFLALLISKRRKGAGWGLVVLWGLVYPVVQSAVSLFSGVSRDNIWLQTLGSTAVSMALLAWASRSWIPAAGCAAGWILTGLLVDPRHMRDEWPALMSVPWSLATGASLLVWAWRVRRAAPAGHCGRCGYDLRATVGRVCPECGGAGSVGGAK